MYSTDSNSDFLNHKHDLNLENKESINISLCLSRFCPGRALSRNASRKRLDHKQVLNHLKERNISIRVASAKLITEEAPESYKDVSEVVDTCHNAGISRKAVKLRPIAVIKG